MTGLLVLTTGSKRLRIQPIEVRHSATTKGRRLQQVGYAQENLNVTAFNSTRESKSEHFFPEMSSEWLCPMSR